MLEKPHFDSGLCPLEVSTLLDIRHRPNLQSCVISRKNYEVIAKNLILGPILGPQSFSVSFTSNSS